MKGRVFYNPLAVLGTVKGFFAALGVVVALAVSAWAAGVHLSGAFDVHVLPTRPSGALVILETLVSWLCLSLLLFVATRLWRGSGSFEAHLAASGLARFPFVLACLVMAWPRFREILLNSVAPTSAAVSYDPSLIASPVILGGLVALVLLIAWSVLILYLGYKQASRLKEQSAVFPFAMGVVLGEGVNRLLLYLINLRLG